MSCTLRTPRSRSMLETLLYSRQSSGSPRARLASTVSSPFSCGGRQGAAGSALYARSWRAWAGRKRRGGGLVLHAMHNHLQRVGGNLVCQAYATTLLLQVDHHAQAAGLYATQRQLQLL